jgi:hypothetical protein
VRNFDWLPFTPLWSPSPVLQIRMPRFFFLSFLDPILAKVFTQPTGAPGIERGWSTLED